MSDPTRIGFPTNLNVDAIGSTNVARDRRCGGALTADSFGKPLRFHCQDQAARNKDGSWLGLCAACTGRERDWRQRLADRAQQRAQPEARSSSRKEKQ